MQLVDFQETIRIGHGWPAVLDVGKVGSHETEGVLAETFIPENNPHKVQIRKKENSICLVVFIREKYTSFYEDQLPDRWKGSEIIWENP
jgi:hypothetical protein